MSEDYIQSQFDHISSILEENSKDTSTNVAIFNTIVQYMCIGNHRLDILIEVLKRKGFSILDMLEYFFKRYYITRLDETVLILMNRIASHATLNEIKDRYGNSIHFDRWYNDNVLDQV